MKEFNNLTTIAFIRHGAVANPDGIYYGRLPNFSLSEEGKQQVEAAAAALAGNDVAAIYHSPLLRTTQSARILSDRLPAVARIEPDDLLLEVHTPFDGMPMAEMAARSWNMYEGNRPPYEQPIDILGRVQRFIGQMIARHPGQTVAAVTHGDVIGFTILWALGREITVENKNRFLDFGLPEEYPATASVTRLHLNGHTDTPDLSLDYLNPYQPIQARLI